MGDKKHIDRLFQEGFKDFEAVPKDAVWENIEAELNKKKKKRRVIPIWWRYAGVAALLLLLLTVGGIYFNTDNGTPKHQVVGTENTVQENIKAKDNDKLNTNDSKSIVTDNNTIQEDVDKTVPSIAESPLNALNPSKESSIAETSSSNNKNESKEGAYSNSDEKSKANNSILNNEKIEAVAVHSEEKIKNELRLNRSKNNDIITNNVEKNKVALVDSKKANAFIKNEQESKIAVAETSTKDQEKITESQVIAENKPEENTLTIEEALDKTKDVIVKEKNLNRWRIAPNAAPVYFNTLGEGSSIDSQFNSNPKSGEVNMSYGITASYAINEKLSVRSGINRVNLGYNTNNVVVFQSVGLGASTNALKNVNSNGNGDNDVSIISGENLNTNEIPQSLATSNTSINQAFGYIEIPLEIQYALLNKKFGINVIGGFSSLFLNNNEIYSEGENGSRTFLGEANNINKISYSANFGLGLNYKVSKKLDLNLEPMFKYQINTFNNTSGDFKPYFIGVYTGFAIKF